MVSRRFVAPGRQRLVFENMGAQMVREVAGVALLPVPDRKRPARASLGIEARICSETSTGKLGSSLGNGNAWLYSLL
jgi:hypothetical protein